VQGLTAQGMSEQGALAIIDRTMTVQASTMAAADIFWMSALLFLALISLVWCTRPRKSRMPVDAGGAH
jgi:DHA2 family multidrug resistance protein